jgi:tetratricopeptide (TPR) repeat protein
MQYSNNNQSNLPLGNDETPVKKKKFEYDPLAAKKTIISGDIVIAEADALIAAQQGDLKKAVEHYMEALAKCDELFEIDPQDANLRKIKIKLDMARMYFDMSCEVEKVYQILKEIMPSFEQLYAQNKDEYIKDLASIYFMYASVCMEIEEFAEAEKANSKAVELYRALCENSEDTNYLYYLARAQKQFADMYLYYCRADEYLDLCEEMYENALDICEKNAGEGFSFRTMFVDICESLHSVFRKKELYAEEVAILERAISAQCKIRDIAREHLSPDTRDIYFEEYERVASIAHSLALAYDNNREHDKAENMFKQSINMYQQLVDADKEMASICGYESSLEMVKSSYKYRIIS